MKRNFNSWRLLTASWLILLLFYSSDARSLEETTSHPQSVEDGTHSIHSVTYPTLQPPQDNVDSTLPESTPSDLDLDFESTTPEENLGSESLETTTSVTSSSSVIVKSGRHFGSRTQQSNRTNNRTAISGNNILTIQPALKPRPTSPMISFNPTNYNRILKRKKNVTSVLDASLFRSRSSQEAEETTEIPSITTTSQSLIPFQRRKLLYGINNRIRRPTITEIPYNETTILQSSQSAETELPTTTFPPRNRRIKLTPIRLPNKTPPTPPPSPEDGSLSWQRVNQRPVPPPPTFDDASYTVESEGIYRFKYSTTEIPPPVYSSTQIYSENFGIRDSYSGHEVEDEAHSRGQEDSTSTTDNSFPLERPTVESPAISIEGSEDFPRTQSPVYRDYFVHEKVEPLQKKSESSIAQVTVTVTVTEKVNQTLHENINNQPAYQENIMNLFLIPTPILPNSSIKYTETESKLEIQIAPTNTNSIGVLSSTFAQIPENGTKYNTTKSELNSSHFLDSPQITTTTSKEYKSVYYTTDPYFSSTSYSFASSTESSFFTPEHDHEHHSFHGDENHHHDHDDHHHHSPEDDSEKEHSISPSSSSVSYWDNLGLKTPQFNTSDEISQTVVPPTGGGGRVTNPTSDDTTLKPLPTLSSSEEDEHKNNPTYEPPKGTTPNESLHPTTIRESDEDNQISDEEDIENEKSKHKVHRPPVAVFIQILIDMPPIQFCPSIKSFKEMIILVYKNNNKEIEIDQVVLQSEPDCFIPVSNKPTNRKSQRSPPVTNRARAIADSKAEEVLIVPEEKQNKTRKMESGEPIEVSTDLFPVYVYINDKNGNYDKILTESFLEMWNMIKQQEGLFFNKIRKVEMIISTEGMTGHTPSNENSGVIAAIAIASIAAICLLLVAILLLVMRHRQAKNNFAKRCTPVTLDDYSLDNISVFNSFRRKQRNRASKRSYTNAGFDDPNAPSRMLDVEGLSKAVKEVSVMLDEFSKIPSVNPTLDDIPNGAESKNRYANVIPMPDTRVLLTFQDDQPNSDYINANFVQGANATPKAYIITQGPLEETIVDFWRMIWEQQVRVIFMVTDFAEAGIPKCGEYYPRSENVDCSQLHGDFQVTLEKRDITENCITSFLVVKDMGRSLRRDVVHLWFHSWPEKGVPENPKSTVDFLQKSRKYTKEQCPILVHCSPGTGRSGTLVACDIGLKELETNRRVDIPQIVKQIRHDRAGAVQTKEQYRHIYEVLTLYGTKFLSTSSSAKETS